MAEYTNIQLAQAGINTTAATQAVNNSRDFHDTIGEGLLVTATGVGVVFAVLVIMIIFINLFKALEPMLDKVGVMFAKKDSKGEVAVPNSQEEQNIDNTTLVLISAAVAAYTHNKAKVRRVRVLPSKAKQGGNWAMQARSALQSSHSGKK
ncbi:MAG: OadG family protein [Mucispirillum sp.]|nr:OadG family protein [Mucispirillum sp.]